MADQERSGAALHPERGADALAAYAAEGFDAFDMADHYGSAEIIAGRLLSRPAVAGTERPRAFTKWCPEPGPMPPEVVRAGIERSRSRLGVARIDLLQLHWWTFEHLAYIDAARELAGLRDEGLIAHHVRMLGHYTKTREQLDDQIGSLLGRLDQLGASDEVERIQAESLRMLPVVKAAVRTEISGPVGWN